MNLILEFFAPYFGWVLAIAGGIVAILLGTKKGRSDGKAEGVQQERAKQVETARRETAVAVETRNEVQAAPKAKVDEKFANYVRPRK